MTTLKEHLGETDEPAAAADPRKRLHRATYARDNKKGGYMIRVTGPYPEKFATKTVPVTMKDGSEHAETLQKLLWKGPDKETGEPVALYSFESKPREEEELPF